MILRCCIVSYVDKNVLNYIKKRKKLYLIIFKLPFIAVFSIYFISYFFDITWADNTAFFFFQTLPGILLKFVFISMFMLNIEKTIELIKYRIKHDKW